MKLVKINAWNNQSTIGIMYNSSDNNTLIICNKQGGWPASEYIKSGNDYNIEVNKLIKKLKFEKLWMYNIADVEIIKIIKDFNKIDHGLSKAL